MAASSASSPSLEESKRAYVRLVNRMRELEREISDPDWIDVVNPRQRPRRSDGAVVVASEAPTEPPSPEPDADLNLATAMATEAHIHANLIQGLRNFGILPLHQPLESAELDLVRARLLTANDVEGLTGVLPNAIRAYEALPKWRDAEGVECFQLSPTQYSNSIMIWALLQFLAHTTEMVGHVLLHVKDPVFPTEVLGDYSIRNGRMSLKEFVHMLIKVVSTIQTRNGIFQYQDYEEYVFLGLNGTITLGFQARNTRALRAGEKMTPELAAKIEQVFGNRAIVPIPNTEDNLCLFYSILLSMIHIAEPSKNLRVAIGSSMSSLTSLLATHPLTAALFLRLDIRRRTELFVQEGWKTCSEFRKDFEHYMEPFLPFPAPIDVFYMDLSSTASLFPIYVSAQTGSPAAKRVRLLCMRFENLAHFALVTDWATLCEIGNPRGSRFLVCSKCCGCCLTSKDLARHIQQNCNEDVLVYNSAEARDVNESILNPLKNHWYCSKCRLVFCNKSKYLYHKENCFMKNRPGWRKVFLCPSGDKSFISKEQVESPSPLDTQVTICFADFECCIDPATGRHSVMSYGFFCLDTMEYHVGYDMEDFFRHVFYYILPLARSKVQIYFHNAAGYDANLILRYVLETASSEHDGDHGIYFKSWKIDVMMESSSKLKKLRFTIPRLARRAGRVLEICDTYKFITMSLDGIMQSLHRPTPAENMSVFPLFFNVFHRKYITASDEDINQVLRKNLFPYKFFDTPAKLDTPIEEFKLLFDPAQEKMDMFGEGVTKADLTANYPLFQSVCNGVGIAMRTARDYHDIYLMCDVMQIADVFNNMRMKLLSSHDIDVSKYLGMPSASWHAFLRSLHRDQKLHTYDSTFPAEFFQKMTRGGVTCASCRHAVADATHTILYLDVNGLYPHVMTQYMFPYRINESFIFPEEYHWNTKSTPRELTEHLREVCEYYMRPDSHTGFVVEVDMVIPTDVQDMTADFPFAPEHREIKDDLYDPNGEVYEFLKEWCQANGEKRPPSFKGLVATMYKKEKYGVHYRLLHYYITHGVIVTKLHSWIWFEQNYFLRDYISRNIELRNACPASDALGKMVYKLMSNAVYGKTFESPFNRDQYVIEASDETFAGYLDQGRIISFTQIPGTDYKIIRLTGDQIVLDKPTYIGACVTEMAKLHMYQLFYDKLRRWYPSTRLLYTDTDSVIVMIEHEPGVNLLNELRTNHPDFVGSKGGQVKSETPDTNPIAEYIGLRAKMYALRLADGTMYSKAKGVTKSAQKTQLSWESYMRALNLEVLPVHQTLFTRKGFNITTEEMEKIGLNGADGKRYICADRIHTLPWGYYKIAK